ncbi:amidase signature domain-containing protein [Hysterangium stoloniferum]|nr:amidase signature domain-containing protein [Hysterangium stoloniferum]
MQNSPSFPDLYEASIAELINGLEQGHFTSVDLVKAYIARISEVNNEGPSLHAVLETNPQALMQAAALDKERKERGSRGPLHGIPLLLKDNIATLHEEGMNTTAGSYALVGSVVPRDATVAAKLRDAGVICIGKATCSEWASYRGNVPSGFCGRGGQGTNPYYPNADPSGSSSGSGIAMAIGLAAGSLGSETTGSIVCPSSRCNIVGMKPTVGLTSRAGVIPLSHTQDCVGPMCRTVADVAIILQAIAGPDPLDEITLSQPKEIPDYSKALDPNALKGVRLGCPRLFQGKNTDVISAYNIAIETLGELGAEIVDPADFDNATELMASQDETVVLQTEFKVDIKKYLDGLVEIPTGVKCLADLIQFNIDHADKELVEPYWTSQTCFIESEKTSMDGRYFAALAADEELGRTKGIDATLKKFNLDAFVVPVGQFAFKSAAIAGYPIISVPLGFHPDDIQPSGAEPTHYLAPGMPFGLCFIGTAYTEYQLISYAYAYEQRTQTRLKRLAYAAAIPKTQLKDVMTN